MTTTATATDHQLLDDLIGFFKRFVIFQDPACYDVLALWVLHTYTFELGIPYTTPYIYVRSAEKQSGKTRTIEVAELFAHNPLTTASASPGALYAAIEARRPTIFLDEVDAVFTGAANEDLRGMLNSGYKRNGTVARQVMTKEGRDVQMFSTFCPKLLAGIDNGNLPDTIADRCIMFNLKRKKSGETVERMVERKIIGEVEALKTRIGEWVKANSDRLMDLEPPVIEEISDRSFEIAEPLLAIGMCFRGWTERSRKVLTHMLASKGAAKLSLNATALQAAKLLMDGENPPQSSRDRITSGELAGYLEISTKRLGILLAPYEITPRTIRVAGSANQKGYHRRDFQDAWERYL